MSEPCGSCSSTVEYPSNARAVAAVARQEGVGVESLRRWVIQAEIDAGTREGQTGDEHAEIKRLRTENRRLREDVAILKAATTSFAGGTRPPQPPMMGFIDQMRAEGYAVESTVRVPREQGVAVAARIYRDWKSPRITARTVTDAQVVDAVRDVAWADVVDDAGVVRRKMTPEGRRWFAPQPAAHLDGIAGNAIRSLNAYAPSRQPPDSPPSRSIFGIIRKIE